MTSARAHKSLENYGAISNYQISLVDYCSVYKTGKFCTDPDWRFGVFLRAATMEGVILFLLSLAIGGAAVHTRQHPEVEFTYSRLLRNYNRDLLPEYGGGPAVVDHGLIVTELRDVDSFRERITIVVWERLVSFNLKSIFQVVRNFSMVRRIPAYFSLYHL